MGSFNLNTGVTTANVQFAIGRNGSFYLADSLGGGSDYDSTGAFQAMFSLPGGTVGDPYTGASYGSADSAGRVYVFDSATGFHQYNDVAASAVPEPSTALTPGGPDWLGRRFTPAACFLSASSHSFRARLSMPSLSVFAE